MPKLQQQSVLVGFEIGSRAITGSPVAMRKSLPPSGRNTLAILPVLLACVLSSAALVLPTPVIAESAHKVERIAPAKKKQKAFNMFSDKLNLRGGFFEVHELENDEVNGDSFVAAEKRVEPVPQEAAPSTPDDTLNYYSTDPTQDTVSSPHERVKVRVMPDAPAPIKRMIEASRQDNMELASQYADQFVQLQKDYFFEVKQITKLIGEALVRQKVIEDDDWIGAEQHLDIEMAKSRQELGALIKPDHDTALKRIKADSQGKAHIFYFFSMSCHWCRKMAPDVERLWQLAKSDPNVSMSALSVGAPPKEWLDEYRAYTGLTIPIEDGTEVAKTFKLGFLPAIVIIAPSENRAYLKTGQQSFTRMYEFLRTVQGLPPVVTAKFKRLSETPIGAEELKAFNALPQNIKLQRARLEAPVKRVQVEKF